MEQGLRYSGIVPSLVPGIPQACVVVYLVKNKDKSTAGYKKLLLAIPGTRVGRRQQLSCGFSKVNAGPLHSLVLHSSGRHDGSPQRPVD